MTRVNSGIVWEYKCRDYFKALGFEVMRAAGSKGAMDLLVWKDDHVIAVQCKKETKKKSYKSDWERLLAKPMPEAWSRQLWVKRGKDVFVKGDNDVEDQLTVKQINDVIRAFLDGDD